MRGGWSSALSSNPKYPKSKFQNNEAWVPACVGITGGAGFPPRRSSAVEVHCGSSIAREGRERTRVGSVRPTKRRGNEERTKRQSNYPHQDSNLKPTD